MSTTPSPTTAPASTVTAALTWGEAIVLVVVVAVLALVAGLVILWARSISGRHQSGDVASGASVVRSWIAVSLTVGILVLAAVSLAIPDASLRSTLIGALTASLGSAIAYYFATKASEQAQQNLLTASGDTVPDLIGKTEADVNAVLAKLALKASPVDPTPMPTDVVTTQRPAPGTKAGASTTLTLTYGAPTPATGR